MEDTTPQAWARETWERSRVELLVPAGVGLALAYFLTISLALRSAHPILLLVCLAGAAFAILQSLLFLYQLSYDSREGAMTHLSAHDIRGMLVPFAASLALYVLIAPNYRLSLFFLFASLPYAAFLLYMANRYAHAPEGVRVALPALPAIKLPTFETIGEPLVALARSIRNAPYFKRS